jgi:hypothetical protein
MKLLMIKLRTHTMKKLFIDAILWMPILFWACQSSSELIISKDGSSDYQIIVPSMASEEEQKAASELQLYFQKMNQVLQLLQF